MKYHYSKTDFYTKKAKEENYPARSVYKLQEIDQKYKIIKAGDRVLDLGCAPGSWLMYISRKVGPRGRVLGVDINDLKIEVPDNVKFIKADVFKFEVNGKFNVVVSDLAPNTTGIGFADAQQSLEFCERALEIAKRVLIKEGNFVCKIFEGEETDEIYKSIKPLFAFAKKYKPKASRKESREIYIIGVGFKGNEN